MTYLVLQTFLLMLAAFFLGALLACLTRTLLFGRRGADAPAVEQTADGAQPMAAAAGVSDVVRFERALTSPGFAPAPAPVSAEPSPRPATPVLSPQPAPAAPPARGPTMPERKAAAPVSAPLPPGTLKVAVSTPVAANGGAPADAAAAAANAAMRVGATPSQTRPVPQRPLPPVEQPRPQTEAAPAPAPAHLPAAGGPSAVAAVAAQVHVLPDVSEATGDDLTRIRGIDAALRSRLNGLGVRYFAEIARWSAEDVARITGALGLSRQIEQENWIEQAHILAGKGAETFYSRRRADGEAPVAASPASVASPARPSAPTPATAPPPPADRLQRIAGIDAKIERALLAADVARYETIAGWTAADVQRIERLLGTRGRISRENWIEQAQILAKGGETAYARALEHQPGIVPAASRPARLGDAIRDHSQQRPEADGRDVRADLLGMRSVRSEAYRGDGAGVGAAARRTAADDLKRIRGIGVLLEKKLNSLGIDSYEQIANWAAADIARISEMLDFKGRIERENWVEQARILASGGHTEFSRRIDRGT